MSTEGYDTQQHPERRSSDHDCLAWFFVRSKVAFQQFLCALETLHAHREILCDRQTTAYAKSPKSKCLLSQA